MLDEITSGTWMHTVLGLQVCAGILRQMPQTLPFQQPKFTVLRLQVYASPPGSCSSVAPKWTISLLVVIFFLLNYNLFLGGGTHSRKQWTMTLANKTSRPSSLARAQKSKSKLWKSRWPPWAPLPVPNSLYSLHGHRATMNSNWAKQPHTHTVAYLHLPSCAHRQWWNGPSHAPGPASEAPSAAAPGEWNTNMSRSPSKHPNFFQSFF